MRKDLVLALAVLSVLAGLLTIGYAQNAGEDEPDAFELRRVLIDWIENAYARDDAATLQRIYQHEKDYTDLAVAVLPQTEGPCTQDSHCSASEYCKSNSCVPLKVPDLPPTWEPPPSPPAPNLPPYHPPPPLPSPWGPNPPPVPDLCATTWQQVGLCYLGAAGICELADDDERNALDDLCEKRLRDCAKLAVLATRLCNDPNRP